MGCESFVQWCLYGWSSTHTHTRDPFIFNSNLQIAHHIALRRLQEQLKAPPDDVVPLPLLGRAGRGGLSLDDAAERRRVHDGKPILRI